MAESDDFFENGRRCWKPIGMFDARSQVDVHLNSRFVSYYNVRFLATGDVRTIFSCRNRARFKCTYQVSVFEPKDKSFYDVKESGSHNHEFDRSQTNSKPVQYINPELRAPPRYKHRIDSINQGASTSNSPAPVLDPEEDTEWLDDLISDYQNVYSSPQANCPQSRVPRTRSIWLNTKLVSKSVMTSASKMEEYLKNVSQDPQILIERHNFMMDLNSFYRKKWGAIVPPPTIDGRPVDLYSLYKCVISRGGYIKVTYNNLWQDVATNMQLDNFITAANFAIQTIYMRFLSRYEQCNFTQAEDETEDSRGARAKTFISSLPDTPVRSCAVDDRKWMVPRPGRPPPYQLLLRSLQSGLANEINFSINVCMLLSHPGPKYLRLAAQPALIDALLSTLGILPDETICEYDIESTPKFPWNNIANNNGMFAEHMSKSEWSKLVQVTTVLRNLSFEPVNKSTLAKSLTLRKFIFLCMDCSSSTIQNMGMDLLSNISTEMDISPVTNYWTQDLLRRLLHCLRSGDKGLLIRAVETIAGLSGVEQNESVVTDFVTCDIIGQFRDLLCVKDVMLSVYILECLYQLSELGPVICQLIANTAKTVDLLVTLATMEAHSFGPRGLQGMKVVEYGPPQPHTAILPAPILPPNITSKPFPNNQNIRQASPLRMSAPQPEVHGDEQQLEVLTVNWLKLHCRPEVGATVSRGELYALYVKYMHTTQKALALSSNAFLNVIRRVFPSSSIGDNVIEGVKLIEFSSAAPTTNVSNIRNRVDSVPSPSPLVQQLLNRPLACIPHNNGRRDGSSLGDQSGATSPESLVSSTVSPSPAPSPIAHPPKSMPQCLLERCKEPQEAATVVDSHETKIVRVQNTAALTNGHKSPEHVQPVKRVNGVKSHLLNNIHKICNGHDDMHNQPPKVNGNILEMSETKKECDLPSSKLASLLRKNEDDMNDIPPPPPPIKMSTILDDVPPPPPPIKRLPLSNNTKWGMKMDGLPPPPPSDKVDSEPTPSMQINCLKRPANDNNNPVDAPKKVKVLNGPFCQWNTCNKQFSTVSDLIMHTSRDHATDAGVGVCCAWPHCDRTPRLKWSLVTHVQDVHCSDSALRGALAVRLGQDVPPPTTPPPHPGYSKTAALDAIRRHALNYIAPEITDEMEGPVTRCIRLTSCLILRNLARYSPDGRRELRGYESWLSYLALSRLHSSRALAQCLAELSGTHRVTS